MPNAEDWLKSPHWNITSFNCAQIESARRTPRCFCSGTAARQSAKRIPTSVFSEFLFKKSKEGALIMDMFLLRACIYALDFLTDIDAGRSAPCRLKPRPRPELWSLDAKASKFGLRPFAYYLFVLSFINLCLRNKLYYLLAACSNPQHSVPFSPYYKLRLRHIPQQPQKQMQPSSYQ